MPFHPQLLLALLLPCLMACGTHHRADLVDDRVDPTLLADTPTDWKAVGPVGIRTEPFIWTCGTFELSQAAQRTMDSLAAVIRSQGGVLCY